MREMLDTLNLAAAVQAWAPDAVLQITAQDVGAVGSPVVP